jgi:hypothetical protein
MNWKTFERPKKPGGPPKTGLTIRRDGRFGLGKMLVRDYQLSRFKYAYFLWDEEAKAVGLKFVIEKEPNVYQLSSHDGTVTISAEAFLNFYNLKSFTGKTLETTFDEETKFLTALLPGE